MVFDPNEHEKRDMTGFESLPVFLLVPGSISEAPAVKHQNKLRDELKKAGFIFTDHLFDCSQTFLFISKSH